MPLLPTPKSWQKIAPNTIEAWLVSDDEREQRLADEALQQLGNDGAINYLHQLLRQDIKARKTLVWKLFATGIASLVCGWLLLRTFEPRLVGLSILPMVFTNWIITLVPSIDTKLQKRIISQCEKQLDIRMLPLLAEAVQNPQEVETGIRLRTITLPILLRQVTLETKHLIPESFWKIILHRLKDVPQQVVLAPEELEYARVHIEVCGNTRYEPALPVLKAVASMNASTPHSIELRQLAAKYVAAWSQPIATVTTVPVLKAEKTPLVAGKWYAS